MRPNQQNNKNRQRGRNNNGGRKHLNPLSRNYESTGPDVKVRGNASTVAEKYLQLARDAQSSGDSVMAENYLQHAEHYFRIVSAAQQQMTPRTDQPGGQPSVAEDDDDDFPPINDRFSSPEPAVRPPQQGEARQPGEGGDSNSNSEGQSPDRPAQSDEQSAQGEDQSGEGDGQRRHRERRRRRRSGAAGEAGAVDPAEAPQPEVELPAFLTAGSTTAAE